MLPLLELMDEEVVQAQAELLETQEVEPQRWQEAVVLDSVVRIKPEMAVI
jgi:hypothetical protein